MGEWDNTAFVATADRAAVAEVLGTLFAASGRTLVERWPSRTPVFPDPMQYGTGATSPRWAAAVLAGKRWTIVKTAPFELLCERVDGRPRLAQIASALGCDAFQVNLYDGDSLILVEANAAGAFRVSGWNASIGPAPYQGFEIDDEDLIAGFGLITPPRALVGVLERDVVEASRRIRDVLFGDADACDNHVQVEHLIPSRPLANAFEIFADRLPLVS